MSGRAGQVSAPGSLSCTAAGSHQEDWSESKVLRRTFDSDQYTIRHKWEDRVVAIRAGHRLPGTGRVRMTFTRETWWMRYGPNRGRSGISWSMATPTFRSNRYP